MKSAYEWEKELEFTPDGKCKKQRTKGSIGAIVPWSIVAVAAIFTGYNLIPASFWSLFKL